MRKAEKKIVGFADILGFKRLIHDYESGKFPELLDIIADASKSAGDLLTMKAPSIGQMTPNWKDCLEVKSFSDCLCISAPTQFSVYDFAHQIRMFYKYLSGYQIVLLEKGIFSRGGVAIGSYYSDEYLIFSGALVEAYELESEKAHYPRIMVSAEVADELIKTDKELARRILIKDGEDYFFNPFNYSLVDSDFVEELIAKYLPNLKKDTGININFEQKDKKEKLETLEKIKKITEGKIKETEDEKVKAKFEWLLDLINYELGIDNKRGFERIN